MKTAILCRINAPLVKTAFMLVKRGLRVRLVGRDVAKKLEALIGEVLDHLSNCPVTEFLNLLDAYIEALQLRFKEKEDKQEFVSDQCDLAECLRVMAEQCDDARCIYDTIKAYFVDSDDIDDLDDDVIVLASGHRSKGLQWPRVIILRPDLCPMTRSTHIDDLRQEEHLWYVMLTRVEGQDKDGKDGELIICADQEPA
jgi:superfamily I DNA/RNA helicase